MKKLIFALLLSLSILCGCGTITGTDTVSDNVGSSNSTESKAEVKTSQVTSSNADKSDSITLNFLSVGQADSIFIQTGETNMLIDAGNNDDSDFIVNYLKSKNVTKLDYVIGTHAHEDHIGGLDAVINNFDISTFIMPKSSVSTKTYEDVLTAVSKKNLKITKPVPGTKYTIGKGEFTIFAPNSETYDSLNNYSVVVKIKFGSNTFLLDGDAESLSENEMIKKGFDLKADLLKLGHHGSTSSTAQNFLNLVKPKYAVISVGKGNVYGHPAAATLTKLKNIGAEVFRTDNDGNIVVTSDGTNIKIEKGIGEVSK